MKQGRWMRWGLWVVLLMGVGCTPTITETARARAQTYYDLGVATFSAGDPRGALKELLYAVKLNPESADTHHVLGLVYHQLGHLEPGLKHYQQALKHRSGFSEAQNNMGVLLMEQGRYDEAIAAFEVALGDILYRTPSSAQGNMGWAYYRKGEIEQGVRNLRNAVAINPKFCRGYEWLIRINLERDRADDVYKDYSRFDRYCALDENISKTIRPDYLRQIKYYYALALLKDGRQQSAREVLQTCATTDLEETFGYKCASTLKAL